MATSALFEKLALNWTPIKAVQAIPAFIYGTAWKKEATLDLVNQALSNGFTALDTAAQPKHYREDLVAAAISRAIRDGKAKRSELYLQTKFTSAHGQDQSNMPYDPKSGLIDQVNASVMSSLRNFNFGDVVKDGDAADPYIDTLILHSPMPTMSETLEVWQTLEQYVPGEIRSLGISNCNLFTLMDLYERANVKPAVVQNRFYASTKYDIGLRKFCCERGIIYESFWTLTANPNLLKAEQTRQLATHLQISPAAALYCLVLGLGNTTILNGTKNLKNMQDDWKAVEKAKFFANADTAGWTELMDAFKKNIGEATR
jgi:diketogulonate reductase-like aldo/keto reductase